MITLTSDIDYNYIIELNINGNPSEYIKKVKKLSISQVLTLIERAQGQYGIPRHRTINNIQILLEK